jgi:hypothetical protein
MDPFETFFTAFIFCIHLFQGCSDLVWPGYICSVLFCSVLFFSVLFLSGLVCTVQYCSALFCVLFCSFLFCSVLFCSVLFCSVFSYLVWSGLGSRCNKCFNLNVSLSYRTFLSELSKNSGLHNSFQTSIEK